MEKYVRLLVTAMFCCMVMGVSARVKENISLKAKSPIKVDTTRVKAPFFRVKLSNENKPIQQGDSVRICVSWSSQSSEPWSTETVVFEGVYTPTPEEVKKGEFMIVVKPRKTTTYNYTKYLKSGSKVTLPVKIVVLDKNGVEIKEGHAPLGTRARGVEANAVETKVFVCRVDFTNRNKPIQKGDSVIINVTWDPQSKDPFSAKKVILEGVYAPTPEEIKKGKYTVVIKPEKTTTYTVTIYRKSGEKFSRPRKVMVLDKDGVEIKE